MLQCIMLLLLLAGCNRTSSSPPPSSLLADSNRDGLVDDKDYLPHEGWSAQSGALFLANLDDDDGDQLPDASDEKVNGLDDGKDLARIRLVAWPIVPMMASGKITLEGAGDAVRLFRVAGAPEKWKVVTGELSAAELAAGAEFAIEGKRFADATWDGQVVLHLVVSDGPRVVAEDRLALRVAPFVMIHNLTDLATLWEAVPNDQSGDAFAQGIGSLTLSASDDQKHAEVDDQWAEDWWQIGVTFMPAPGGTTQGMRVAQRSAQPNRKAGQFAEQQLGKDMAFIWPHTDESQGDLSSSLDSFGNHDTLPPYSKGAVTYPLGRILIGGNETMYIDPEVRAFYDAQRVQPVFQVDTAFLLVGHVDEIFSYVPAHTPRGWKLLVASPKRARAMLLELSQAGHGNAVVFAGMHWWNKKADTTVDNLLTNPELMAANELAQLKIDEQRLALQTEIGLTADEIVEMPFLFERVKTGGEQLLVAHMPGTVNLRSANGSVGIPKPHGPVVAGVDLFEKDLVDRLGTAQNALGSDGMGLKIHFVEDWDDYHALDGEVHCGTTSQARPMPNLNWWGAGR